MSTAIYFRHANCRERYVSTPALVDALRHSDNLKDELQKVPLRRFAKPEEIAEGVCFLASPMSAYMCGVAMLMDG